MVISWDLDLTSKNCLFSLSRIPMYMHIHVYIIYIYIYLLSRISHCTLVTTRIVAHAPAQMKCSHSLLYTVNSLLPSGRPVYNLFNQGPTFWNHPAPEADSFSICLISTSCIKVRFNRWIIHLFWPNLWARARPTYTSYGFPISFHIRWPRHPPLVLVAPETHLVAGSWRLCHVKNTVATTNQQMIPWDHKKALKLCSAEKTSKYLWCLETQFLPIKNSLMYLDVLGAHRTLLVLVVGSKIMISSSVSLVAEKYELIASGLFLSAGFHIAFPSRKDPRKDG